MISRADSRRRRGLSMVESSVGLVLLLLVTFGIMEFAQLIMARQLLNNAAWSASIWASKGYQPSTYPDGTATPSPGGIVDTPFLDTWITKALAASPLSGVNPSSTGFNSDGSSRYYGANSVTDSNGNVTTTPNTALAWNATKFGDAFYVDLKVTYVPLFSGNRLFASSGNTGPMVGGIGLRSIKLVRSQANN